MARDRPNRLRVAGARKRDAESPSRHDRTGRQRSRSRTLVAGLASVGLVVLGAVLTEGYGYFAGPENEVRAQHAVEADKDRKLSERPAVLGRVRELQPSYAVDGWSWMFAQALSRSRVESLGSTFVDGVTVHEGSVADGKPEPSDAAPDRAVRAAGGTRTAQYCPGECQGASRYKVVLTGHRRESNTIEDIRARIVGEKPPIGTLLWSPLQGGEPLEKVIVDLDSDDLGLQLDSPDTGALTPYVDARNVTLAHDEQLGFEVTATSSKRRLLWELVVTAVDGTGRHEIVIRSDGTARGDPFETVGWSSSGSPQRSGSGERARGGFYSSDFAGGWDQ